MAYFVHKLDARDRLFVLFSVVAVAFAGDVVAVAAAAAADLVGPVAFPSSLPVTQMESQDRSQKHSVPSYSTIRSNPVRNYEDYNHGAVEGLRMAIPQFHRSQSYSPHTLSIGGIQSASPPDTCVWIASCSNQMLPNSWL